MISYKITSVITFLFTEIFDGIDNSRYNYNDY